MIVEVGNTEIEFPDDMSEAEILAVIKREMAPEETYDPTEGMSGFDKFAAGVGKGITDLGRGTGQLLGLVDKQTIRDADERDRALMNTGAGVAGNIVGVAAPLMATAMIPGANTMAGSAAIGAASGLLAPISDDSTLKGKARSAATGAVLGPLSILGGRAAHSTLSAGKGLLEPFTKKGQDAIVGRVLNRFASNADDAARAASTASSRVPGYQPTLAEATQDAGLATLQRAIANTDAAAQIGTVERANAVALKDALGGIAKDDAAMAAALGARSSATNALYDIADNAVLAVDDELKALMKRPVVKSALNEAKANAANRGESVMITLGKKSKGIDGKSLHAVKKAIDDAEVNAKPGTDAHRAIIQAKQDFLDWLETRIPEYGQARETYAQLSRPINQMEIGQGLLNKLSPALDDFAETGGLRAANFAGAMRDPRQVVKQATGRRGLLDNVLEPDQMDTLEAVGETLANRISAGNLARPVGTNTAQNLASQNLMRQIAGPLGLPETFMEAQFWPTALRPVNFALRSQEPQINSLLGMAVTDPRLAARLMQMGVPKEKIGPMIQQIARYGAMPGLLSANTMQQ